MKPRVLLLSTTLAGFAMVPVQAAAQGAVPAVVADTPVVHSLAAKVMGDLGSPTLLLDRGADPHNFQLRPTQAQALSQAGVVFWVGPELAPWMERAIDGVGVPGPTVALLQVDGLHLRDYAHGHSHDDHGHDDHGHDDHAHDHDDHGHDHDDHAHDQDDHGHDHDDHDDHGHDDHGHDHAHDDHAHDGLDPHAWLDPRNAAVWVEVIAAQLSSLDPDNADTYAANAEAALATIAETETEVTDILAPVGDAPIVVFHDAYGYFAHRFGVTVAGTIALGDAAAPGAARLTELRDMLREGGIACIFPEVNHSSRHVEMLVEGTETRVGTLLDPAGVAMEPGAELYPALLRNIANGIADCVTGG